MQNGENLQALHKNLELVRFGSILVLLIHFYCVTYPAVSTWGLTIPFVTRLIYSFSNGLFFLSGITIPKLSSLLLLIVSQFGQRGQKDNKLKIRPVVIFFSLGLLLYFLSIYILDCPGTETSIAVWYIGITSTGYLLLLFAGARLSRILSIKLGKDPFNTIEESFPQEERLIENESSFNLRAQYKLKGRIRRSWINVVNPYRAIMLCGTPGAGKSFYCVREILLQSIKKGYTLFVYDFKFPDLTLITYNTALKYMDKYPVPPKLYIINFDDLTRSHRCNLIAPETMIDITDATESSRTIMLALNREWLKKQGEFFTESPINFVTALFWFLKKYDGGRYCTLPHAIELAQVEYEKLFPVLSTANDPGIDTLINPFCSALVRGAAEQLEGQVASAKIGLARLVSPSLYYILTGNDFTLDINDPEKPKIVCVGNNPSKTQVYGAVLSLCTERMLKLVNKKGRLKSSLVFDEYPTIICDLSVHISTARSNKSATTICVQDISQLKKEYGREQADVLMNVCGNIISGQVLSETAKLLSERLGKIMQDRESLSINSSDTSISRSTQLEAALQPARIANLSSGEFVGAVADQPSQKIPQKVFHCEILNDPEAIAKEEAEYQPLPVIRNVTPEMIERNYYQIKKDIKHLIDMEMAKIQNHPQFKAAKAKINPQPPEVESL